MLAEELGNSGYSLWEFNRAGLAPGGTVVVQPGSGLVGPGDHRRAAGRADRAGNIAPCEQDPLGCKGVDIGRGTAVDGVSVASQPRGHVLDEDPENVGLARGRSRHRQGRNEAQNRNEEELFHHELRQGLGTRTPKAEF